MTSEWLLIIVAHYLNVINKNVISIHYTIFHILCVFRFLEDMLDLETEIDLKIVNFYEFQSCGLNALPISLYQ